MKDSEKTRDIKKIACTAVSESWEMSVILVYGDVCTVTCTVRPCVVFSRTGGRLAKAEGRMLQPGRTLLAKSGHIEFFAMRCTSSTIYHMM